MKQKSRLKFLAFYGRSGRANKPIIFLGLSLLEFIFWRLARFHPQCITISNCEEKAYYLNKVLNPAFDLTSAAQQNTPHFGEPATQVTAYVSICYNESPPSNSFLVFLSKTAIIRGAVNKFVEQGIYQKQALTTLILFESLFFHMPILAILGVCYFPPEQGYLKSKPTFYHSSDDTFELSFSET